jgi:hypothetical protein
MEKKIEENLIHEATKSNEKSREGFEMTSEQAGQITAELSKLNDAIAHDKPIKIEDLEDLSKVAKGTKIDIGGEITTVEEVENNPNVKIWNEIKNGNYEHLEELTYITSEIAKILSRRDGELSLGKVIGLSDLSAQYLSEHQGTSLVLWGLKTISDKVAEFLARYPSRNLLLSTKIEDKVRMARTKLAFQKYQK